MLQAGGVRRIGNRECKGIGSTSELMKFNLRNCRKISKQCLYNGIHEAQHLEFQKTIDFALEFLGLNLKNSNTTMAFSLGFLGFNMRHLKKFIALTLEFMSFKMGNVKNKLVYHWIS